MIKLRRPLIPAALIGAVLSACTSSQPAEATAKPVYSKTTGKLEQLVADENADGKPDTRAFMDGATLKRIEIDRNRDGRPDRWEEYVTADLNAVATPQIVRAEEANGADDRVTRREQYEGGALRRVEEDTDLDGRMDKWETYEDDRLIHVDLDLDGAGKATRRLTYMRSGEVTSGPVPTADSK